jgi:hypothetical protein
MNTDNLENTSLKQWEAPIVLELQMDATSTAADFSAINEGAHAPNSGFGS